MCILLQKDAFEEKLADQIKKEIEDYDNIDNKTRVALDTMHQEVCLHSKSSFTINNVHLGDSWSASHCIVC